MTDMTAARLDDPFADAADADSAEVAVRTDDATLFLLRSPDGVIDIDEEPADGRTGRYWMNVAGAAGAACAARIDGRLDDATLLRLLAAAGITPGEITLQQ